MCEELIQNLNDKTPILGVCLGHQAICEAFGAKIVHAKKLMHGKQSHIELDLSCPLFKDLPKKIDVARYHSLAVEDKCFPSTLKMRACRRWRDYGCHAQKFTNVWRAISSRVNHDTRWIHDIEQFY